MSTYLQRLKIVSAHILKTPERVLNMAPSLDIEKVGTLHMLLTA